MVIRPPDRCYVLDDHARVLPRYKILRAFSAMDSAVAASSAAETTHRCGTTCLVQKNPPAEGKFREVLLFFSVPSPICADSKTLLRQPNAGSITSASFRLP